MYYIDFELLLKVIGGISAAFAVIERVSNVTKKVYKARKKTLEDPPKQIHQPLAFEKKDFYPYSFTFRTTWGSAPYLSN